jgi:hypothetical protein
MRSIKHPFLSLAKARARRSRPMTFLINILNRLRIRLTAKAERVSGEVIGELAN